MFWLLFCMIFFSHSINVMCWKIIWERAEVPYKDPSMFDANFTVIKINRTTFGLNYHAEHYIDLPPDAMYKIKVFGKFSNRYVEMPINIVRLVCDVFKMEYKFMRVNEVVGHFPSKCPVKKGHYYFKDLVANTDGLPFRNVWKTNNFIMTFLIIIKQKARLQLDMYVRTTDDDEYIV